MTQEMDNLLAIKSSVEEIALKAAESVMGYYGTNFNETLKSSFHDVVTEADKASEEIIVAELTSRFPAHHIVGEEGGGAGAPIAEADYRWYVDPIDGTTNFANAIPLFAISLGLTDRNQEPLVGVVYNPVSQEMFTAAKGHGAWLNGQPIHVSKKTNLQTCVLATGFPHDKTTNSNNNLAQFTAFEMKTRGVRRIGSSAIELSYLAMGRLDGYWEFRLNPWDTLGGVVCVREAGGIVSDFKGEQAGHIFTGRHDLIVANPTIHPQMLDILSGFPS